MDKIPNNDFSPKSSNEIESFSEKKIYQSSSTDLYKNTNTIIFPKETLKYDFYCLGNNIQHPKSPITVCSVDNLNTQILLEDECSHNIVDDYIDITPDRSMKIKYCDICMKTFN